MYESAEPAQAAIFKVNRKYSLEKRFKVELKRASLPTTTVKTISKFHKTFYRRSNAR
jgi:hypothetical protein